MALEPADETLGRYRLFARLGRGGMAELHLARMLGPARVEKFVVIKRMLQHLADDSQFVQMFENEGRIAVRLDHPNVCQTYELGNVDGQLFLVMELVRGLPWSIVANRLPRDELAASRFIVGVMTQACEGLHYAHHLTDAAGNPSPVVHRDVTPGNLMITNEGSAKLLDFGVSKLLNDEHSTRAGMIKGKLPYMSPEHIKGELVDSRADVFSLAVVMWEALARRTLFERPSDLKIFKAIVEDPIPPLPQTAITQRLEVVLRRALAKNKAERQPSARQLADELRDALSPFGLPMTQAQIQQAMAEWLHAELATAHQDLASAISRLRASEGSAVAAPAAEPTRTSIDFVMGRAAETHVGSLAGVDTHIGSLPGVETVVGAVSGAEGDTEEEGPTAYAGGGAEAATYARGGAEAATYARGGAEAATYARGGAEAATYARGAEPATYARGGAEARALGEAPTRVAPGVAEAATFARGGAQAQALGEAPTRVAPGVAPSVAVRMPSEPSVNVPTAPRPVQSRGGPATFDEPEDSNVSSAPTAPRTLPQPGDAGVEAPTQKFHVRTPAPQPMPPVHAPLPGTPLHAPAPVQLPPPPGAVPGISGGGINAAMVPARAAGRWQAPAPQAVPGLAPRADAAARARFWVIVLVMVSVAAGVIAAIMLN